MTKNLYSILSYRLSTHSAILLFWACYKHGMYVGDWDVDAFAAQDVEKGLIR